VNPMKIPLPENAAEVLEAAWTLEEKGQASIEALVREAHIPVTEELIDLLCREKLIVLETPTRVRLTDEGRRLAEQIIRRHRLAERLICDVLDVRVDESEGAACEFEHILAEGITNSICTLLGHPRYCPHNRPIPEGDCCRQAREELRPIVVPSDQLRVGESGRIAYISTREHARLLKLASLGLSPGVTIKLLQKWPSYVIECDETEIAVERDIARRIYVWRSQDV